MKLLELIKINCVAIFILCVNTTMWAQSTEIVETYLNPTKIIWLSDDTGVRIKNVGSLLKPGIHQADLYGSNYCELQNSEGDTASVILDFGKEIQGGVQLVTAAFPDKNPIKVRLRFGESVSETLANIGEDGATNDHAMRDFEVLLPWMGKIEVGSTGFRFLRIDLLDQERTLKLKEVSAISQLRDIPYRGSFESNNERLNKIWKTGAYTVHLNMQEFLWDGIKRDRLVWVGDMHPEVMTINSVFGFNEVVPKSLDYSKNVTPVTEWMNGISSYSLWWILIQYDWYMAHGNKVYLSEQHDYLKPLLSKLCSLVDDDGNEHLDGTRFLDWPSSENKETIDAGYSALLLMALRAGKFLMKELEEDSIGHECKGAIERLQKRKRENSRSKQGAALLSLAGLMEPHSAGDVLYEGSTKNFSTFYGYYMLEALAKAGMYEQAMEIISEYWGGMLDLGATTFWEDFNTDWLKNAGRIDEMPEGGKVDVHREYGNYCYEGLRHSFCHGWASGPTAWLSRHVLGVKVLEPGCTLVKIEPKLGRLKWVKGTYPTPKGEIRIEHYVNEKGEIVSKIDAPTGIRIIN